MRRKLTNKQFGVKIGIGVLALMAAGLILPFLAWGWVMNRVYNETQFHKTQCDEIVADLASGRLRPDAAGRIRLPTMLSAAACGGYAYVTPGGGKQLMVLVPCYLGDTESTMFGAYLYDPLAYTTGGVFAATIVANGPQRYRRGERPALTRVKLTVDRQIAPGWWAVHGALN